MDNNDEIGFETPSGFKRKADEIRNSWGNLVASFPDDQTLRDTAREFETWHYNAVIGASPLSQMLGTDELNKWLRRYADEYVRLTSANPKATVSAPKPDAIMTPEESHLSPWFWPITFGIVGATAISLIWLWRK